MTDRVNAWGRELNTTTAALITTAFSDNAAQLSLKQPNRFIAMRHPFSASFFLNQIFRRFTFTNITRPNRFQIVGYSAYPHQTQLLEKSQQHVRAEHNNRGQTKSILQYAPND